MLARTDSAAAQLLTTSPRSWFLRGVGVLLGLALLGLSPEAAARDKFELDGTFGYRLGGGVDVTTGSTKGHLNLEGAPVWGAIAGYRIQRDGFVYLSYSRQETTADYRKDGASSNSATLPFATEYLQFGGNITAHRGLFWPYFGFSLGAARFSQRVAGGSDDFRFSLALDGGVKFEPIEHVHLRLLGRVPITLMGNTSRTFCITDAECSGSLGSTPLMQAEVEAGLGISF